MLVSFLIGVKTPNSCMFASRVLTDVVPIAIILCMSMVVLAACGGSGTDSGSSIPENPGNVYRVIVNDESGAAVQGVMIQFCSDSMCLMGETDADGIAAFEDQAAGAYTVHVYSVPDGYAEDTTEYAMPETYGDVNITLKAAE